MRPAVCQVTPRAASVDGASAITWTISRPSRYRSGRDLPTLRCGFPALISRQVATTVAVAFSRTLHRVWNGNEPASLLSRTACSPRSIRYRDAKTCPWLRPRVCDDSRACWAPKIVASSDGDGAKPWGGRDRDDVRGPGQLPGAHDTPSGGNRRVGAAVWTSDNHRRLAGASLWC